ncbi:MAG: PTS sugar transporter subunit IIB [Youngiibacter sp.]|nr:PTS sugar transporter subunit IIB [Youngiibacter sp.]
MIKIVLLCGGGMSTSVLMKRMQAEADKKGLEAEISAFGEGHLPKVIPFADVILLGPQIRFTFKRISEECVKNGIPVAMIPHADYGMMDGKKVLALAEKLIEERTVR